MKYFYLTYVLISYFYYINAEESPSLAALAPKCECGDILDKILCQLTENSKEILTLNVKLVSIRKESTELQNNVAENTCLVNSIETDVTVIEQQQNQTVTVINNHTAIIVDIETKLEVIIQEQNVLETNIEANSCTLADIKKTLLGLQLCQCSCLSCS
ncbi:uncharacterized protein LOC114326590 [Diabrotica virgifera virgifera]|uniref:Uncharacterized protein n=1 Tax=Diabrotica virgifera virgifera TaxID=50390 RepID=A0ABM5IE38_DIAVI|nr:uncharacterized protein LOC114326590 [Diabrotica virgifera virgifera]